MSKLDRFVGTFLLQFINLTLDFVLEQNTLMLPQFSQFKSLRRQFSLSSTQSQCDDGFPPIPKFKFLVWFYQGCTREGSLNQRNSWAKKHFTKWSYSISIPWYGGYETSKETFGLNFAENYSMCLFLHVCEASLYAHLSFTHRWPGEYKDYTDYTGWGKIYVLPSLTLDLATASSLRFSNIWYLLPIFSSQMQT